MLVVSRLVTERIEMVKPTALIVAIALCLSTVACSSKSTERQEKIASCEQVKEVDENLYQECMQEAQK